MGDSKLKKSSTTEQKEADTLWPFSNDEDDSYPCNEEDTDANYWLGEYFWSEPSPLNKDEFRQFKLLTLLHLLGVKSATEALKEFSWD